MEDWQVQLQLQAMAVMVRVEGMKADNEQLRATNEPPLYNGEDFERMACEIESCIQGMHR